MKYASRATRLLNFIIDTCVVSGITFLGFVLFLKITDGGQTVYSFMMDNNTEIDITAYLNIYFYTCYFLYYLISEAIFGRTVEKLMTGSIVVNFQNKKPELRKVLVRSLIRLIPLDWFTFFKSNPMVWHDSISETKVIYKSELANER